MKCPYCQKEMEEGFIHSGHAVFYSKNKPSYLFVGLGGDIALTKNNYTKPKRVAHRCKECQYVIVHYEDKDVR